MIRLSLQKSSSSGVSQSTNADTRVQSHFVLCPFDTHLVVVHVEKWYMYSEVFWSWRSCLIETKIAARNSYFYTANEKIPRKTNSRMFSWVFLLSSFKTISDTKTNGSRCQRNHCTVGVVGFALHVDIWWTEKNIEATYLQKQLWFCERDTLFTVVTPSMHTLVIHSRIAFWILPIGVYSSIRIAGRQRPSRSKCNLWSKTMVSATNKENSNGKESLSNFKLSRN